MTSSHVYENFGDEVGRDLLVSVFVEGDTARLNVLNTPDTSTNGYARCATIVVGLWMPVGIA
jgi:hypothetical protein